MALPGVNAGTYRDYSSDQKEPNDDFLVKPKSIYGLLDERFTVFRALLVKSGYHHYLNEPGQKYTVFAFPDQYLLDKSAFDQLDLGETIALMQTHICPCFKPFDKYNTATFLYPTLNQYNKLVVNLADLTVGLFLGEICSAILSRNEPCINGSLLIIKDPLIPDTSNI